MGEPVDLELDLPEEYAGEDPPPVMTVVEWNKRMSDRKMLICNADGVALGEHGSDSSDGIISFTPYLRANLFNGLSVDDLYGRTPGTHHGLRSSQVSVLLRSRTRCGRTRQPLRHLRPPRT